MTGTIRAEDFSDYLGLVAIDFQEKPLEPVLRDCVPVVRQSVRDNFTSSATPEGLDWPARNEIGDGHPLLMDTGKLMQAAVGSGAGAMTEILDRSMQVGVDGDIVPYAAIHNYGGVKRPMPKREYLGAKPEHLDDCGELIADFVVREFFE